MKRDCFRLAIYIGLLIGLTKPHDLYSFETSKKTRLCSLAFLLGSASALSLGNFYQSSRHPDYLRIVGSSMYPTLTDGQVLSGSLLRRTEPFERGSIVQIAENPSFLQKVVGQSAGPQVIKRLLGLPGDRVTVKGFDIWVNGHLLVEPYANKSLSVSLSAHEKTTEGDTQELIERSKTLENLNSTWILGPDAYFVVGDNRPFSYDSRLAGPIRAEVLRFVLEKKDLHLNKNTHSSVLLLTKSNED